MRSDIFKQIENNRSSFYCQLNNLKKNNDLILDRVDKRSTNENTIHEYSGKTKETIPVLVNRFIRKFPKIVLPTFISLQADKKRKKKLRKRTSGINQFIKRINQYLIRKTDSAIERFYVIGSRVFEDNTDSFQSYPTQLEAIPVSSSAHELYSISNIQQFANQISSKLRQSGIIQSFNNLQKNILIYFEADTFTFTKIIRTGEPTESKEISYEPAIQDFLPINKTDFEKQKVLKTKKSNLLKYVSQKSIIHRKNIPSSINRIFSKFNTIKLFPVLNRFI